MMNQGKKWTTVLAALACLALLGTAWAQTSPNYDLSWHVMAGGGMDMASSGHTVRSTLGQFAIGPTYSTGHTLGAGYWYGIGRAAGPPPTYYIYLPLVTRGWSQQ